MKRIISLLLAACLLLGLAGCGRQDEAPEKRADIVYLPESTAFMADLAESSGSCAVGNDVYLVGKRSSHDHAYSLLRVPLAGGEPQELPDFQPGGIPESESAFPLSASLQAGPDGTMWLLEELFGQTYNGQTFDDINLHLLRQLDGDGRELRRLELLDLDRKLGQVWSLTVDGDGDIFALTGSSAALLDGTGEVVFALEPEDGEVLQMIPLSDGRAAVASFVWDEERGRFLRLQAVDKKAGAWGESWELPADSFAVCGGSGDALFYYLTESALCAWQDGQGEAVLSLLDTGIEGRSFDFITVLEDGRLALMANNRWDTAALSVLRPVEAGSVPEKKVLTLATFQLTSSVRAAVQRFNQTSSEYRVAVTDYSQYGDRDAALTRLVTEIGEGAMPDLLELSNIPTARWAAKGMLEDLWPYIDSDSGLGRDALMERVFQAAEINGKLYEVGSTFRIQTLTGAREAVGDRMTWTGEDMWTALEAMPEGCIPMNWSRTKLLDELISLDWSRFVDWETGECRFESGEFRSLLEFCRQCPEEGAGSVSESDKRLYEGQQMLLSSSICGFFHPQTARFLLGGEPAYVGYPNQWGKVGSSFYITESFAMSSTCQNKDGAWAFLRTLLLPQGSALEVSSYSNFPVNKADFRRAAEIAMTPQYLTDWEGEPLVDIAGEKMESPLSSESFAGLEEICAYYAMTQEDYDRLMALYDAVDTYDRGDLALASVIAEAAGAYFAGDKEIDEAVELIQSRAELYVGELM